MKKIFPDEVKIAKITPIFRGGDDKEASNCRPISVLPIMYSRRFKHLTKNKIIYSKTILDFKKDILQNMQ